MNAANSNDPFQALHDNLHVIVNNIAYVRQELPRLRLEDELRATLQGMCDEFDSALYDVRTEARALEEQLQNRSGAATVDAAENGDPKVTLSLIEKWLRREIEALDGMVGQLDEAAKRDVGLIAPTVLVTESVPSHAVGTALTVQVCIGFLLTTLTIQAIPPVVAWLGWQWAFIMLAVGPMLGILAIRQLQRERV